MKKKYGGLALFFLLFVSCSTFMMEKNLTPEEKDFLSKVRYIITRQERKTFLSLPPAEREAFIQEFWKRRDPDPDTEKNEFKERYYVRIEEANRLFSEAGHHGWLQDRGRVYILLGPPEQRETYPRGVNFYDPPSEIWHYGFHRIYFIDYQWNGNYVLIPESARMLAEINVAQIELRPSGRPEEAAGVLFDFNLKTEKTAAGEIVILVELPYRDIQFTARENRLETALELSLKVTDQAGKKVYWEEKKAYSLSLAEHELKEARDKNYVLEVPLGLNAGEYLVSVTLINTTGQSQVAKKIPLTIEKKQDD
ncbi:MAG: GWxTD domain-containing protein [Acidobacteriota bacterium]